MLKITPRQKKIIMWITIFMIAFPMPIIIYYGMKFQDEKPPAVGPVKSSPS